MRDDFEGVVVEFSCGKKDILADPWLHMLWKALIERCAVNCCGYFLGFVTVEYMYEKKGKFTFIIDEFIKLV